MYLPRGSLIQLSVSKPLVFVFPKYVMILVVISVLFIFWRDHKLNDLLIKDLVQQIQQNVTSGNCLGLLC